MIKVYLFEIEDETGIGLMALDETGALEMEKVLAPGNKITGTWVEEMKFTVGLNSDHDSCNVIYVKNPDDHTKVPKLYEAWQAGAQLQATPQPDEMDQEAVQAMRDKCHLCASCLMRPICSVAQAIASAEHVTLAVLSHCNTYAREPNP